MHKCYFKKAFHFLQITIDFKRELIFPHGIKQCTELTEEKTSMNFFFLDLQEPFSISFS